MMHILSTYKCSKGNIQTSLSFTKLLTSFRNFLSFHFRNYNGWDRADYFAINYLVVFVRGILLFFLDWSLG